MTWKGFGWGSGVACGGAPGTVNTVKRIDGKIEASKLGISLNSSEVSSLRLLTSSANSFSQQIEGKIILSSERKNKIKKISLHLSVYSKMSHKYTDFA